MEPSIEFQNQRTEAPLIQTNPEYEDIGNHSLPIWNCMPEIVETLKNNDQLILVSETGSGKTTQVPQALLASGFTEDDKKIYVIENRVAVTVETAKRVAQELDTNIGEEVGYLTGPEKNSSANSKIVFMTSGVFKNIIRSNPQLDEASIVIFDEFDERYLLSDIGLSLVEKAQKQGSKTKFLLMSATLNAQKFSDHFGGAPVIEAKGRPYPVEAHFTETYIPERLRPQKVAELAAQIHQNNNEGDILIFMPGKEEIAKTIEEMLKQGITGATMLPLHSQLQPQERQKVFQKTPNRKIIVSTNLAERGLTIDGVKYVIDSGLVRAIEYEPNADTTKLLVVPTAQDSLLQRKGRAGRTQPGECYYLITKEDFDSRPVSTEPEILRTSLREVVLQIKAMGYSREGDPIRLIDSPDKESWKAAKDQLRLLGALDHKDETKLSEFGLKLAELSCDPREGTMILAGCEMGCGKEMAIIAAIRTSKPLFYRPKGEEDVADAMRNSLSPSTMSDLINLLYVYEQAEQQNFNYKWCKEHYISVNALREIRQNYSQLTSQLKRLGYDLSKPTQKPEPEVLCKAIARGFKDKIFEYRTRTGRYRNIDGTGSALLANSSKTGGYLIVANELIKIQTKSGILLPLITLATRIEKEWFKDVFF
ncbi:MAG: helicase-related protein [Candidatus Dojkabacteria bacterium]